VVILPLIAFVFVQQFGHNALHAADSAANRDHHPAALMEARRARRWLRWSEDAWRRVGEEELATGRIDAAAKSLHEALDRDPMDWGAWFDLALASHGAERSRALAEASRLNPLSPEIEALRR
jgi:predicted TPR repeat methyltransferase